MPKEFNLISFAFLLSVTLGACASPKYNYTGETTEISRPALGIVTTVGVGEEMLAQGKIVESDAIHILQQVSIGTLGGYTLSAGDYTKVGDDKDSSFYLPSGGRVTRNALSDPFQAIQVMKVSNSVCAVSTFGGKVCEDGIKFSRFKKASDSANSFQQSLIYSGKVSAKINIGYREFSNSRARPAFNNDVEYDLNESNVIGYKGAELEILDATNRSIKYKVIKNFNRAVK